MKDKKPKGTADEPAALLETLAAISAHTRNIWAAYQSVYEAAYGLAGRSLQPTGRGSPSVPTESAVIENPDRERAQDAVVYATAQVREAQSRLGAALSKLQKGVRLTVGTWERAERQAKEQRRARARG